MASSGAISVRSGRGRGSATREDDFRPFLFRTTDSGRTWTRVTGGLPDHPINVVVEDRIRRDLLFVGNDRGVHVSIGGGERWAGMKGNMPPVPVHDMTIHPREHDLVVEYRITVEAGGRSETRVGVIRQ